MPRYSKPIDQMIWEAIKSLGGEASIGEVFRWIRPNFVHDDVKRSTVSTAMSDLSVNGPPSSLYPS